MVGTEDGDPRSSIYSYSRLVFALVAIENQACPVWYNPIEQNTTSFINQEESNLSVYQSTIIASDLSHMLFQERSAPILFPARYPIPLLQYVQPFP